MTATTSAIPAPDRSVTRWWRDPLLVSASVSSLVLLLWAVSGRAYVPVAATNSWVTVTGFEILQAVIAVDIARLAGRGHPARPFYLLIAVAAFLFVLGGILQIDLAVREPYARAVAVGLPLKNALIGVGALFLITALVTSPLGLREPRQRLRFWLDGLTVMIAVAVYAAGFTGLERSGSDGRSVAEGIGAALLGPAVFLTVVLCLFKGLLGGTPMFTYAAGVLSAAAAAMESLSISTADPMYAAGRTALPLSFAVLANFGFLAALRIQQLQARTDPGVWQPRERRSISVLPFLAVAGMYAMLIWTLATVGVNLCAWLILATTLISTALVIIRQTTSFIDVVLLQRRVDSLTAELAEARRRLAANGAPPPRVTTTRPVRTPRG